MSLTLQSLLDRLSIADRCYRRPSVLDFEPGSTEQQFRLLCTGRNAIVLTYQMILRQIREDAERLRSSASTTNTHIRIANLLATVASRLLVVDEHIRTLVLPPTPTAAIPFAAPVSASSGVNMHPSSGADGSVDRHPTFGVTPVETHNTFMLPNPYAAAVAQSAAIASVVMPHSVATASPADAPFIIRTPTTHDFRKLNVRYLFHGVCKETSLVIPPPSWHGFPLYIQCTLSTFLNNVDHLSKTALMSLSDAHHIAIPSTSTSRIKSSEYKAHLCNHRCDNRCIKDVYCFTRLAAPRPPSGSSEGTHASVEASRSCPLKPADIKLKHAIVKEWQQCLSTENQKQAPCGCCSRGFRDVTLKRVLVRDVDFSLLRNDALPQHVLPTNYAFHAYDRALLNPLALSFRDRKRGSIALCRECIASLNKGKTPKYSLANWLYYGYDRLPDHVRSAFDNATTLERTLIGRARGNRITFRYCTKRDSPQYGWNYQTSQSYNKGNIMILPQDSLSLASHLPPPPETIRDTMAVLVVSSSETPTRETVKKLNPCLVRKSRVLTMIQFLLANNPHYKPDATFSGLSLRNLDLLSGDGADIDIDREFVPPFLEVAHLDPASLPGDYEVTADYTNRNEPDPLDLHANDDRGLLLENVGYTTGDTSTVNYNIQKVKALQQCTSGGRFLLSREGSRAESDFNNPNLLTWLYPHLDPWGIGGFHHPRRKITLTLEEQLAYLLSVYQSPFATDPSFPFVYYNILMKKKIVRNSLFRIKEARYRTLMSELRTIPVEVLQQLERKYQLNHYYQPSTPVETRVHRILSQLQCVNYSLPGTTGYKLAMRNELRSLIYKHGLPALFVTLNPNDVNNPLVRLLVGHDINLEDMTRGEELSKFDRHKLAADNPHATAQFFDRFMEAFIQIVLRFNRDECGLFGKCKAYYGTVETQGKGTLHCHYLIWLDGHLSPDALHEKMMLDPLYKTQLFEYLESIIKCELPGMTTPLEEQDGQVTEAPERPPNVPNPAVVALPQRSMMSERDFETAFIDRYTKLIYENHWHRHNATCWKYLKNGDARDDRHCRMRIDGSVEAETHYDSMARNINIRRLHPRVNSHNDVLAFLTQSNNDIKFIGTGEDAKAVVYYFTNYITKESLPTHVGLSALRAAIDHNNKKYENNLLSTDDDINKSLFVKCANAFLGRMEISHSQVMSYLVGGGDRYKSHTFTPLSWDPFRRVVMEFFGNDDDDLDEDTNPTTGEAADENVANENDISLIPTSEDVPIADPESRPHGDDHNITVRIDSDGVRKMPLYNDYIFRSRDAAIDRLSLYEFVQAVRKESRERSNQARANPREASANPNRRVARSRLDPAHPDFERFVQVLRTAEVVPIVIGRSFAHPNKGPQARIDWCCAMMILFKPWRNPLDLKARETSWIDAFDYTEFPEHLKQIMKNILLMDECKDARDRQAAERRQRTIVSNESFQNEPALLQDMQTLAILDEALDVISARVSSLDDTNQNGRHHSDLSLLSRSLFHGHLDFPNTDDSLADNGRLIIDEGDHRQVQAHSKYIRKLRNDKRPLLPRDDEENVPDAGEELGPPIDEDFYFHVVQPSTVVTTIDAETNRRSARNASDSLEMRPESNPTSVMNRVIEKMHLNDNEEQLRAFKIICNHFLRGSDQLLMYIGGVGGTGKSHVINSVVMFLVDIKQRDQLVLAAPTGAAAIVINGLTIHSITYPFVRDGSMNFEALVKYWRHISFLVIDEVSMIGATFMAMISKRLNQAKGLAGGGEQFLFGGLNVVFLGDMCQLPPVHDNALFDHRLLGNVPNSDITNKASGQMAIQGINSWRQVDTVVLLRKNQRQKDDPQYAAFLERFRVGRILEDDSPNCVSDISLLRSRLLCNILTDDPSSFEPFKQAPVIVGCKKLRDKMNQIFLKKAANEQGHQVFQYHSLDKLHKTPLEQDVQEAAWKLDSTATQDSLGLLPLFVGMKVMLTENVSVGNRLVNGAKGIVHSILYDIDQQDRRFAKVCYVSVPNCQVRLENYGEDVAPVIPTSKKFEFRVRNRGKLKIDRTQLPLLPAYSFTDYKSQGSTLPAAIVDLATTNSRQGAYVMLSRVNTLRGLAILRDFDTSMIEKPLSGQLRTELKRLEKLDAKTTEKFRIDESLPSDEAMDG